MGSAYFVWSLRRLTNGLNDTQVTPCYILSSDLYNIVVLDKFKKTHASTVKFYHYSHSILSLTLPVVAIIYLSLLLVAQ